VSQPQELPEVERLHEGETQTIQLALELQLPLLIEETVGRRVAQSIGVQFRYCRPGPQGGSAGHHFGNSRAG